MTVVRPFIERPDRTIAAGGIIRVANGCEVTRGHVTKVGLPKQWLPMFQTVEYLRAFTAARTGWSMINSLLIISGAFGIFRKDAVIDVGGYATDSIGEDFELCMRLHARGCASSSGRTTWRSCRTRCAGPRRPRGWASSAASATAGTAASPTRSCGTGA